jgi:hypothetical protein
MFKAHATQQVWRRVESAVVLLVEIGAAQVFPKSSENLCYTPESLAKAGKVLQRVKFVLDNYNP